jgi:CheY-like chemotaxis protein
MPAPHLVVLDVDMPDMNGPSLAASYNDLWEKEPPLLILLTPLGWREENFAHLPVAAYLTKPVKPAQLAEVLVNSQLAHPGGPAPAPSAPLFDRHMGRQHPLRILVAEDNMVNQKVIFSILERIGYRADMAGNGLEVLEALMRQVYDVVLMDVQMPDMDGLTATRIIRQQWPFAQQPHIIAMTANALRGDREKCLAAGMNDYISKPIQVQELTAALGHSHALGPKEPPPTPESPAPAVDLRVLTEFKIMMEDDGPRMACELISIYLQDTPTLLAALQANLVQHDAPSFQRMAHTLKSSSAQMGAKRLAQLCLELEELGEAQSLAQAPALLTQAIAEYDRVKTMLEAERQNLTP